MPYLTPEEKKQLEDGRLLKLPFECLWSVPGGINEVRLWWDPLLKVARVGKRIDMACIDDALPEPETLQAISHKNIVPIVSAAVVQHENLRLVELVTPYFERGSVTDALLRGERFKATEAVQIVRAVLSGLRELHEVHRVIHRDVKSGNVLLCEGHPYAIVADLGLAGRMDADGRAGVLNNPTLYTPREFIETGVLDAASDIYGVGLMLRELLGGPFDYERYTRSHVVQRLTDLRSPIDPIDLQLPVWTPRRMSQIYRKATAADRYKRYQSAREMDEDLARAKCADWELVDNLCWEAPAQREPGVVRVQATPAKAGGYNVIARRRKNKNWKVIGQVAAEDLRAATVRNLFNQATMIACA
jgi:serine/threonine protein kinase